METVAGGENCQLLLLNLSGFYARGEYKTENVNFTLEHIFPSFWLHHSGIFIVVVYYEVMP